MSEEKKEGEILKLQDTDDTKHVVIKVNQKDEELTVLSRLSVQDNMILMASALAQLRNHLVESEETNEDEAREFMLNLVLGMVAPHINYEKEGGEDDKTNGIKSRSEGSGKRSDKTKKDA